MTRISFYVLNQTDIQDFSCRLLERINQQAQLAYVFAPEQSLTQALNERLWTFKDGSFLAHDLEQDDNTSPIVLGAGAALPPQRDVLLNLDLNNSTPPDFFSSFERCLEIVAGDDAQKAAARQRFGFYRSRGYDIETHQIGG